MAASRPFHLLFLLSVLLLFAPLPPAADGLRFGQWGTLLSLSRSLLTRVANTRAARGDIAGSERVRLIADKLNFVGFGGSAGIWSLGWDFARNYAWRGGLDASAAEISRAAGRLLAALAEANRMDSGVDRVHWALGKYPELVAIANSLIRSLLQIFSRSGPLREMVLVIQREVAEGEFLRDCMEVSMVDLEGVIRIARDIFTSNPGHWDL